MYSLLSILAMEFQSGRRLYLQVFVLSEVDFIVPFESAERGESNGTLFTLPRHTKTDIKSPLLH